MPSNREKTTLSFTEKDTEFLRLTIRLAEQSAAIQQDHAYHQWLMGFKERVGEAHMRVKQKTMEYRTWKTMMDNRQQRGEW